LIDAALRGREQAFDSLVGPLIEPAFGLAYTLLRQPEEAEDAVPGSLNRGRSGEARSPKRVGGSSPAGDRLGIALTTTETTWAAWTGTLALS